MAKNSQNFLLILNISFNSSGELLSRSIHLLLCQNSWNKCKHTFIGSWIIQTIVRYEEDVVIRWLKYLQLK